jgi:ATP-dependent Lon protease
VYEDTKQAGVAIGLAWTSVGGEILFIESLISKGKGTMQITGNLGDVMKESASTALSLLKSHQGFLEIAPEKFEETNLHIHIPAGAIPKDGPSAGIALCTALASVYTGRPLRPYLAMTGEITLRGKVLPVGGIKEKVLAAKRAGIREIILCSDNRQDVLEINPAYIAGVQFHYVDTILQVWELALSN